MTDPIAEMNVRVAAPDDVDMVAATITLAFADDPTWGPALSRSDGIDGHQFGIWRTLIEGAIRYGWTRLLDDGAAVSVWIPPGGTELSDEQEERLGELVRSVLGDHLPGYNALVARFEANHPHHEPHYYLSLLATHPAHRGKGLGLGLLAHDLALIDVEGAAAYLESTNPGNNPRYQRYGFEPIGAFAGAVEGRLITTMWRPARRADTAGGEPQP